MLLACPQEYPVDQLAQCENHRPNMLSTVVEIIKETNRQLIYIQGTHLRLHS